MTFHDPCYLGRHDGDYLTPRTVLGALPGVELVEMDRAMADALCCGGGGGNFFTDVLGGGADSPSRVRVREAAGTGAEVLAVACPKCAGMFDDAIKAEDLEDGLRVMDIAELVQEHCAGRCRRGRPPLAGAGPLTRLGACYAVITLMVQAEVRPITWAMPALAPSCWRPPDSPRICQTISEMPQAPVAPRG